MIESANERAGGLWKDISAPNTLCDNCHNELPDNAIIGKGKHAVLVRGRLRFYCKKCYYYYQHRNDPELKKKKKLS